jgi:hypothetical protein
LIFLSGCSVIQRTTENNYAPQLLVQYPLPTVTGPILKPDFKIEMNLYIQEDGSVGKVVFIKGSGDNVWDSLAMESVLKWKYSPAHVDHHNVKIWLNQVALVEIQNPKYLMLAEIVCPTLDEADSVYTSLENGKDYNGFTAMPDDDKNIDLGKVDIHLFPHNISSELVYLEKDEYTKPLKFGDSYVIFKRK